MRLCVFASSLFVLVALAAGCSNEPVALVGMTMGTTYSVKVDRLPSGVDAKSLQSEIDARLELVNDQMSTWRDDSELSRFNAHDGIDWFPVSAATAKVVAAARDISEQSGGAFDATVMPLVNLWSFGPEARPQKIPTDEELAAVRGHVGWRKLHVRDDPPALKKDDPRLAVDLSAIAKGYGVDVVAEYLDELKVAGYMVEIGGEVRTLGNKPDGGAWRIGIEAPLDDVRQVYDALELTGSSLATSGNYRHYFLEGGKRYSHTIDPRTGRPIEHRLASVSVVADDCMTADALATTLMVLGPDAGYDWAKKHDLAALFLVGDGEQFEKKATPRFERRFGE
ncbi:MAG: FAD:protein FMN transferase [Planctomycetaceae bacterium]